MTRRLEASAIVLERPHDDRPFELTESASHRQQSVTEYVLGGVLGVMALVAVKLRDINPIAR